MEWYFFVNNSGKKGLAKFTTLEDLMEETEADIKMNRHKAMEADKEEERNAWEFAARTIEECSIWKIKKGKEIKVIERVKEAIL